MPNNPIKDLSEEDSRQDTVSGHRRTMLLAYLVATAHPSGLKVTEAQLKEFSLQPRVMLHVWAADGALQAEVLTVKEAARLLGCNSNWTC